MKPFFVIRKIFAFNPFIESAILKKDAMDDAAQEVEIAWAAAEKGKEYRESAKALYNLATQLGFSRKKGADSESEDFSSDSENIEEAHYALLDDIRIMYVMKDMTAKQVCDAVGGTYSPAVAKALNRLWPKKGWGGKRR